MKTHNIHTDTLKVQEPPSQSHVRCIDGSEPTLSHTLSRPKPFFLDNSVQMKRVGKAGKRNSPLRKNEPKGTKLQLPGSHALAPECALAPRSLPPAVRAQVFRA